VKEATRRLGPGLHRPGLNRLWLEALFIVSAYALYLVVRGSVGGREGDAYDNAGRVIDVEQWLGIFREAGLQEAILRHDAAEWLVNTVYIWGHLPVIIMVAVWLYLLHRAQYSLFRNAFLFSGAFGLLLFFLVPTAPPHLLPQYGFVDIVSESASYYIWQPPALVNQYAAMPSLHFGWNVLVAVALFANIRSNWRYAALLMPAVTGAAAVLSANHFFLDLAAGAAVALAGLGLACWLRARLPRRMPFTMLA
jgi:hypothetical protein